MSASLSRMYKKIHLKPPTITFSYVLKLRNKHKRSLTSKLFKFLLNPKSQLRGRTEPLAHILAIVKLWNNDIYINKNKNGKRLFPNPSHFPKHCPFSISHYKMATSRIRTTSLGESCPGTLAWTLDHNIGIQSYLLLMTAYHRHSLSSWHLHYHFWRRASFLFTRFPTPNPSLLYLRNHRPIAQVIPFSSSTHSPPPKPPLSFF